MNWRKFVLAVGAGVLSGYLLHRQMEKSMMVSPEKALRKIKQMTAEKYDIHGSWIHMKPEPVNRYGLDYNAYHGGITLANDEQVQHYRFLVDADTGAVLDLTLDEE